MSLVKIKSGVMQGDRPVYAVQVGTRREGPLDDPFWMVYFGGMGGRGYPYEDHEVKRIPAHRGEYYANHGGEEFPDEYDAVGRMMGRPRHRKEGEAN